MKKRQSTEHTKHAERTEASEESEISLNMRFDWFKRINMDYAVATLFVLFCLTLVLSMRLLPASLPVTDSWAESTIRQNIRNQVAQQVDQQYPALPDTNRNALIDKRTDEFISAQQTQLDAVQTQLSEQFKTQLRYSGDDGKEHTYLGDLDSYFWLRYMRNFLNTGTTCDTTEGGCRDMYTLAPVGTEMGTPSFHVFAIYGLYKFITVFNPAYPLPATSFLVQAIIGALAVIPAFFIGRRLAGNVGGFFAAVLIALNPLYLSRSLGSDNDVWNIFIPLLIMWMVIEAVDSKSNTRRAIFAALAAAAVAFHAIAWEGWWFIYLIILFGLVGYALFRAATIIVRDGNKRFWTSKQLQGAALILGVFYISAFIFLLLAGKGGGYAHLPIAAFSSAGNLDRAVADSYWPNVLTTVAELNKSSFSEAVGTLGGKLMFFVALIGMLLLILPRDAKWTWKHYSVLGAGALIAAYLISAPTTKLVTLALLALPIAIILLLYLFEQEHVDVAAGIIVLVWFLATTYAAYSGVRFILLMIPAFGIAFAVAAGRAYEWLTGFLGSSMGIHKYITNTVVFLIIALVLFQPVRQAYATSANYIPSIEDAWWDSLTKIRTETAKDSIINSWWDFGHWFKYVADRRVSADGTTQHTHVPRWLGLALVTPDEDQSIGVLRMLDCGSDSFPSADGWYGAYGRVLNITGDPVASERTVRELIEFNTRSDAKAYLEEKGFTPAQQEHILGATHCQPPDDYLITSSDMIGKAGVWAHFGLWDFQRAYIVQTARDMPADEAVADLTQRFNYTQQEAETLYYEAQGLNTEQEINAWVAPWPSYTTGAWSGCQDTNTTLTCPLGIVVNRQGNAQTVIDGFIFNKSSPDSSAFVFGLYQDGQRVSGITNGTPSAIIIADAAKMRTVATENPQIGVAVLIDTKENRVLLGDQLLLQSMFTQLYYLDGRYSQHYVKFDDRTGFTGTRIVVWKVDWDGNKTR